MRIALISDIHGNLTALEAALADIRRRGADQIICLGDVAVYGPQPRESIARLRDLTIPTVMGNTDQWLLNPEPWSGDEEDKAQIEIEMWNAGLLSGSDQAAVAGYVPLLPLDYGDGFTLLAYHGSPRNFNDRVRPTTPEEELDEWFPENRALVMAGGHTHEAMIRRYGEGTLVNPGSVGQPSYQAAGGRSVKPTWAEYALVEWDDGALAISLLRVPYPLADLQAAALSPRGCPTLKTGWPTGAMSIIFCGTTSRPEADQTLTACVLARRKLKHALQLAQRFLLRPRQGFND